MSHGQSGLVRLEVYSRSGAFIETAGAMGGLSSRKDLGETLRRPPEGGRGPVRVAPKRTPGERFVGYMLR